MPSSAAPTPSPAAPPPPPPPAVRRAGLVVAAEGVAGLVFAVTIALATASDPGGPARAGYGTAGYFGLVGVGVVAAGVALVRGRKGARAPAIVAQILLLGLAWYLLVGSSQPVAALVLAAVAVVVLVLLVGRATSDWVAAQYRPPMS